MPDFARRIAVSFLSRPFRSRSAFACPGAPRHVAVIRATAGVVAAALLFFTAGILGAPIDGTGPQWAHTRTVHALPALHSSALRHGEIDPRTTRRAAPHANVPLAAAATTSIAFARTSVAPAAIRLAAVASIASRGYDATAPPVS